MSSDPVGFRLCGCGRRTRGSLWFCDQCAQRIQQDFGELQKTLSRGHRGAGGAAVCICGAGCGGTQACSALGMLKNALQSNDDHFKASVMYLIGWGEKPV